MSIAEQSLRLAGMFEAEVLTTLLLWRWDHPLKDDADFANGLLEEAAAALQRAVCGEQLLESVPASETNFIAAIYYAEWNAVTVADQDIDARRQQWLDSLRRSIPSCFCAQGDLPSS